MTARDPEGPVRDAGDGARAAAERLRQVGLGDLLAEARRRVEANDGIRGTVALDLDPPARAALADLIGWRHLPAGTKGGVRLPLTQLDAALRASRFASGLAAVLEADGGRIVTRRGRREQSEAAAADQLGRIASSAPVSVGERLLAALSAAGPCGRWYRRTYREDPAVAERAAVAVAAALAELPAVPAVLLAVFAARVTGDPHTFDRAQPAGALLYAALRELGGVPPEDLGEAEAWAFVLARSGLDLDDVSSTVLAAHLSGAQHPVLAAMAAWGRGWPLPLGAIRDLAFARTAGSPAFVVENPQVFAHLVRATVDAGPMLVCTRGFLSAAAIRLLDSLHAAGHILRYGGDFDRNGLVIAAGLLRRYPDLKLWRMGPADYREAAEGARAPVPLPPADMAWLERVQGPLAATARAMAQTGVAAYQERLAERLLRDLGAGSPGGGAG